MQVDSKQKQNYYEVIFYIMLHLAKAISAEAPGIEKKLIGFIYSLV